MGWDMQSGICKKRFPKPVPKQFLHWFGELRRPLHRGCSAEAARNLQPYFSLSVLVHLLSFIASTSSPIFMLLSHQKPLIPMTTTHTLPSTHSVHPLCRPVCRPDLTTSHSTQPLTLVFAKVFAPPSPQTFLSFSLQASGAVCDLAECHWECPLIE